MLAWAAQSMGAAGVATAAPQGPQGFSNAKVADIATKYVGKSRRTGYNQPGECIKWVQSWVREAGGSMGGGGPVRAYTTSPAKEISISQAQRGDVFQISKGDGYAGRPHTGVLLGARGRDGAFDVVEGNVPAGSGRVRTHRRVLSSAGWVPPGHRLRFWRFGKVAGTPKPNPLKKYKGKIVQWSGDKKSQKTAWLVDSKLRRRWIPSAAIYHCLKARGVAGPFALPASTLDKLEDRRGVHAKCTPPAPAPVHRAPAPAPTPSPAPAPPTPKPAPQPTPKPPAPKPSNRMSNDQRLLKGQYLRSSDGRYRFVMQTDSNLVLYGPRGRALWASNTVGRGAHHLRMQGDGNLVIYTGSNKPIWASGTPRRYDAQLVVQNDGNVVIYNKGKPVWATGTDGRT